MKMKLSSGDELIGSVVGQIATELYPELGTVKEISFEYTNAKEGVQLLVGYDEDEGKFKIAFNKSADGTVVMSFFAAGFAMLVFHLQTGQYIHPVLRKSEAEVSPYKTIYENIMNECKKLQNKEGEICPKL